MNPIAFDDLAALVGQLRINAGHTYHVCYPEFVRYFASARPLERHHLIVGSSIVYGWMPTIVEFKSDKWEEVVVALNRVQVGERISRAQIETVKGFLNNSVVGASKLLHFVNPGLYPIWDGKVCKFIHGRDHNYIVNDAGNYMTYTTACEALVKDPRFPALHRLVEQQLPYRVSPYRAIDLVVFESAR